MNPASHYDLRARDYSTEAHGEFYKGIAEDLLNMIPPTAPSRILEIGCGSGFSTEVLATRFPDAEIIAMDPAPGMLDIAREKLGQDHTFVDRIPGHEQFDLMISSMSLHWTTEEDRTLIVDQLAADGLLCIAAPGRLDGARAQGNQLLLDSVKRVKRKHPEPLPTTSRGFDCDSIKQMFPRLANQIGCNKRNAEEATPAHLFPDSLEVRGALLALFGNEERIATALSFLRTQCKELSTDVKTLWPIIHSVSRAPR